MPRVSVLLPVYNAEKHVSLAINSILKQTFTDFELIVIDDGSSDASLMILNSFNDHRLKVYHQANCGIAATLNTAARHASGEFLARIDADDICLPERFSKQVAFLNNHLSIAAVGSAVQYIDEDGVYLARSFPVINARFIRKKLSRGLGCIAHPTVMMRSEAFRATGGYNETLACIEDTLLWAEMVKLGYSFANIATPLIKYRLSKGALSNFQPDAEYLKLSRKLFSNCSDIPLDLATAFTNKRLALLNNDENITVERIHSVSNTTQYKLYKFLKTAKLPEIMCEQIVCFARNSLDIFR